MQLLKNLVTKGGFKATVLLLLFILADRIPINALVSTWLNNEDYS